MYLLSLVAHIEGVLDAAGDGRNPLGHERLAPLCGSLRTSLRELDEIGVGGPPEERPREIPPELGLEHPPRR